MALAIEICDPTETEQAYSSAPAVTPARGSATRILLIEDHPIFCEGLRALLQSDDALDIVAQAIICRTPDIAPALELVRRRRPDLILLDIRLGEVSGLDLVGPLRRICPESKIAALTAYTERDNVVAALRLGVHGFLSKDMAGQAFVGALHAVMGGERIIGQPQMLTAVLEEFGQLMQTRERDDAGLAANQVEILRLAASGLNNREIGSQLFWSEITVKRKMQDIYRRLGVKGRAQAVAEAMRLGLI